MRFKFISGIAALWLILTSLQASAQKSILETPGTFLVGCNYWASHAGTHTWSDWRPEVVEADFKQLSTNGIKVLRVFPLWPDFQPIVNTYTSNGRVKYIGFKDRPLPLTGPGANGMSEEQLQHFGQMADLAEKYHLKLVVGLITGWMSGELYVPQALEGKNILTDPESLTWQQKFVTTFVTRFKDHKAILAWDFGNECNVMEKVANSYQAYVWSAIISGAIKSADNTRPVVSGMHTLSSSNDSEWRIADQAALTDVLTTHPYSLWTPYASQDGINTMRTILHGAAETRLYGDIGNKACLTEETGVMGPMTGGEKEKSAFARTALFSNWANDCRGTFWWCAYDQTKFDYPPYNYSSPERELGLIKEDRMPKPVLNEFKNFSAFIDHLPFKTLPQRKTEAVCILTENQDSWAVGYASFILAKQAGFDFRFQKAGQELQDAPLYLVPSLKGYDSFYKNDWFKLLEKVKNGATLYLSLDDAYLPTLTEPLGIDISTNTKRRDALSFTAGALFGDTLSFKTTSERKYQINPGHAAILATEADGNPALLQTTYGKGKIYLLTFPLELNATKIAGSFDESAGRYSAIYKKLASSVIGDRIMNQANTSVGITEHVLDNGDQVIVMINYNPKDVVTGFKLKDGWKISKALYGDLPTSDHISLKGNDALVLICKKNS